MADNKVPIDIVLRMKDRASRLIGRTFSQVNNVIKRTMNMVFSLKGAFAALGFALTAKSFLGTASSFETLRLQLETVEGSASKAEQSFSWIKTFTAKTPYELKEVTDAFVRLRAYGIDAMNGSLRIMGDTASAMGKDLISAIDALAAATTGENERLKQFGIVGKVVGDQMEYTWTDRLGRIHKDVAERSPKIIEQTLLAIWNEKYAGGMERQEKSWKGMVSNVKDIWTLWQDAMMNSGPFQALKAGIKEALTRLKEFEKDGTLKRWAEKAARGIVQAFEAVLIAVGGVIQLINFARLGAAKLSMWWDEGEISGRQKRIAEINERAPKLQAIEVGKPLVEQSEGLWGTKEKRTYYAEAQTQLLKLEAERTKLIAEVGEYEKSLIGSTEEVNRLAALIVDVNEDIGKAYKILDDMANAPPPTDWSRYAGLTEFTRRDASMEMTTAPGETDTSSKKYLENDFKLFQEREKLRAKELAAIQRFEDAKWEAWESTIQAEDNSIKAMGALSKNYYDNQKAEIDQHAARLRLLNEDEVAIHRWATEEKRRLEESHWQAQFQSSTTFYDAMTAKLHLNAMETEKFWQRVVDAIDKAVRSMANAVGQAVAAAVVDGKSFLKTLEQAAKGVVRTLIAALVEEAIMYVIYSKIKNQVAAEDFASRSAMNVSLAATTAGASAASGGPWAAAASAAATAAAVSAAGAISYGAALSTFGKMAGVEQKPANLPKAHGGKDFIPREEPWLLDRGEGIVNAKENTRVAVLNDKVEELMGQVAALVAAMKGNSASGAAPVIHLRVENPVNIDGVQVGLSTLDHVISGAVARGRTTLALKEG